MRNEVERANQARLSALPGDAIVYDAADWTPFPDAKNTYLENFMAPKKIVLKIGAQVMLIKNLDLELVNGTVGKVIGFGPADEEEEDQDELSKDKKLAGLPAANTSNSADMTAPKIAWSTPNGITIKTMVKEDFKVEDVKGVLQAKRSQVSHLRLFRAVADPLL